MRKYAYVDPPIQGILKVMLYEYDYGVYLFPYKSTDDVCSLGDDWFCTLTEAEDYCKKEYRINPYDWVHIGDPMEHCQHDVIAPIRIKGRNEGKPQWGYFEELINGKWVEIDPVLRLKIPIDELKRIRVNR